MGRRPVTLPVGLALAAVIALGLPACGSGDIQTVTDQRIPFSFQVPKDFKKGPLRSGSFQGPPPILAYGVDRLNLIDVRRSAARELPLDTVDMEVKRILSRRGSAGLKSKREKHGDVDMVVFDDVENTVGGPPPAGHRTRSRLYFFKGAGGTWELECQSTEDKADVIAKGCMKAVDSVKFN